MNLKDRLESIKNANIISIKKNIDEQDIDIKNFFVNFNEVSDILKSIIEEKRNVVFVSDNSIDKSIVVSGVKSIFSDFDIEIFNSIDDNIVDSFSKIKLFPNPLINDVVKIFEYIIYGYNSFIFSLEMTYDENFIDKLKAVIAVNFKNLTEENINTLIGCSDLYILPINRNEDGLFIVSEVIKLNYSHKKIYLELIKKIGEELQAESFSLADNLSNDIVEVEEKRVNKNLVKNKESITSNPESIQDEFALDIAVNNNEVINELKKENSEVILTQEENFLDKENDNISNESIELIDNTNDDINLELLNGQVFDKEDNIDENNSEVNSSEDNNFSIKKVNKYKILREKIRSKRNE